MLTMLHPLVIHELFHRGRSGGRGSMPRIPEGTWGGGLTKEFNMKILIFMVTIDNEH